jgi:hypothetical protein
LVEHTRGARGDMYASVQSGRCSADPSGMGLGLTIARRNVEANDAETE